jgi:hypothetical protein
LLKKWVPEVGIEPTRGGSPAGFLRRGLYRKC